MLRERNHSRWIRFEVYVGIFSLISGQSTSQWNFGFYSYICRSLLKMQMLMIITLNDISSQFFGLILLIFFQSRVIYAIFV